MNQNFKIVEAELPVLKTVDPPNSNTNRCGSCDACCTALGIDEDQLKKKEGVPCEHLCGAGCGIYRTRPNVCRSFECNWLELEGTEESYRPDNSGLLCFYKEFPPPIGIAVQATELFGGAADRHVGRAWLTKLRTHQFTTVCGDRSVLPICIIRFRSDVDISRRPMRWLVSRRNVAALETVRNWQERDRISFGTSRNAPCGCGSGIKFKKCHFKFRELVVTD